MSKDTEQKRNGKFVNIEYAEFTEKQNQQIMKVTDRLKEIFKDRPIKVMPLYGQVKIYIELAPIVDGKRVGVTFKEKGVGEYMIRVNHLYPNDDFTGIIITFNNHIGYSNNPLCTGDYKSKEKQLEVWVGTPNFRLRRRWHKEFEHWEVQPHFDYAYDIDTLYDDTILPAIRKIIETFRVAYPELPSF
jgi:hypothetical protein